MPHITGLGVSNFCEVGKGFLPIHSAIGGKLKEEGGDIDMRSHLHTQVNRKVSHFIVGEEGKVGSRSAFTAAAFIGATSLAGILLSAPNASADWQCGDFFCDDADKCCGCWNSNANVGFENCAQGSYDCKPADYNPGPGISCWFKP